MTAEWTIAPLGELVTDIVDRRGVTPLKLGSRFVAAGFRVISAKLIKHGRIDLSADEPRFVDEYTYRKWMATSLLADDVILTSEAPLGEVAYMRESEEWCLGQRLFGIRTDKNVLYGRFLYYALQSDRVRKELQSRTTGTTVLGIRQSQLRQVRIPCPDTREQRAIAHILGALDDKIELNRQMNETLEAMARALFKSWFIDFDPVRAKAEGRDPGFPADIAALFPDSFQDSDLGEIPKGWRAGRLGDVSVSPRRSVRPHEISPETPYVALEHMPRGSIALTEWGDAEGLESSKFQFEKGEILFGKLRPYFHKVGVAPVDGVCSTDIVVLAPRAKDWLGFVLGHASSVAFVEYTNSGSTGTKMPRTSWSEMARYPVALPTEEVAKEFSSKVCSLIDKIVLSVHESHALASLRDALLPKLLSGELRVKDVDDLMEAHV